MILTICGSMSFVDQMKTLKAQLEKRGHTVYTPVLFDFHVIRDKYGDEDTFNRKKEELTKRHFKLIEKSDAIVVLNCDKKIKNSIFRNYIGGNTFAEIAVGKYLGKRILLTNPIPLGLPYTEELKAWRLELLDLENSILKEGQL